MLGACCNLAAVTMGGRGSAKSALYCLMPGSQVRHVSLASGLLARHMAQPKRLAPGREWTLAHGPRTMVLLTDLAESGSFIKVGLLQHPTLLLIPVLIAFRDPSNR